jgi:hypothetical protein
MKRFLLLVVVVILHVAGLAQTLQISTKGYGKSTFNEIVSEGNVVEYYSYVDGVFHVYDLSFKEKVQFSLEHGKDTRLLEVSRSSNYYLFVLFSSSSSLEIEVRNDEGVKKGDWALTDLNTLQEMQIGEIAKGRELDYNLVFPIPDQGFIIQLPSHRNVYGLDVKLLDFNAKEIWSWSTESASGAHYFGDILTVSSDFVLMALNKKNKALANDMEVYISAIDVNDGHEVYSRNMVTKENELLSVQSGFVESKDQIITTTLFGEFYLAGKNPIRDRSEGLFIQTLDIKGEELTIKKLNWSTELKATTSSTRNASLCVHRAVRAENGELVVIGEQFKKALNMGTAFSNMAFDDHESALEIQIHDLVVFRFSSSGELLHHHTVENPVRHITWTDGSAYQSSVLLMRRIKRSGHFAYRFSTLDTQAHLVRVVYSLTYDPEFRGKKHADIIIGVVDSGNDGMKSFKVPLKSDVSMFGLYGAKSGSISVAEFNPKLDLLSLKLVDLKATP